jgi:hypothetical protein
MADHADDNITFVYMGGSIPYHLRETITHVHVHKSVKIITPGAFYDCRNLVSIEMHDGVYLIDEGAFYLCSSLKGIKLSDVRFIGAHAFNECTALADVEFGVKMEIIGDSAFARTALSNIKIPPKAWVGDYAFYRCKQLMEVDMSDYLEERKIGVSAFHDCRRLRRIVIPLKDNLLGNYMLSNCDNIKQVDIVGGIHQTVSSLLLDSWRNEMTDEIDRINRDLPNTDYETTAVIQRWMEAVLERIDHYKAEHYALLKEFTTLLELALWKAKLDESQDERSLGSDQPVKKAKIDMNAVRQEKRITSGANIVIRNVLPFLKLE